MDESNGLIDSVTDQEILEAYPVDLTGFAYDFKLLHSEIPFGEALPTGFILVSDALYDYSESDSELAFVIAHEVAHVEMDLIGDIEPAE